MKTRQLKIEEINAIRAGLELLRRTMENGGKGYVRGNVRVVSMRANHLKSDASVEEFIAVCEDLEPVAHHLYNPDGGNCLDDDEIGVLDGELEGAVVFVGGARAQG